MIAPQTKMINLAKELGLAVPIFFKREDLHPYKSHKGRSIPLMIDHYAKKGAKDFVISSSGNAALAAALFIIDYNKKHKKNQLNLKIMTGLNIDPQKLQILWGLPCGNITVEQVKNPKQTAFQMEKNGLTKNLRQSNDDLALLGYAKLARELAKIPAKGGSALGGKKLSAIFIPTSSGTTAEGIYKELKKLKINPEIHIIQTEACHPIADIVNGPSDVNKETSRAGAIVDKVALRKNAVAKIIEESDGAAWIATDKNINNAIELVKSSENLDISPNSALSVAGLQMALKNGWTFEGPVVCLITGK